MVKRASLQVAVFYCIGQSFYAIGHFFKTLSENDVRSSLLSLLVLAVATSAGLTASVFSTIEKELHGVLDSMGWDHGRWLLIFGAAMSGMGILSTSLGLIGIAGPLAATATLENVCLAISLVATVVVWIGLVVTLISNGAAHIEADKTYRLTVQRH